MLTTTLALLGALLQAAAQAPAPVPVEKAPTVAPVLLATESAKTLEASIANNTVADSTDSGIEVDDCQCMDPGAVTGAISNNAITGNGTEVGTTGGRFGVVRESSTSPDPVGIHLLNNLICGNRLGEINGPALDGTDAGNLTPTGGEGPGVCRSRSRVRERHAHPTAGD